jgi:hypothetical protein
MPKKKRPGRSNHKKEYLTRMAARLQDAGRGQALVILAISFFALLAFIGLVTDVGQIYVAHTQLQRAIDAAAVAAANNIKNPQIDATVRKQRITEAAREMLLVHQITGVDDLQVFLCTDSGRPASFVALCPTGAQAARKLVYIEATQDVPVFFLQIFGVRSFPLHASAVGETAAVDLVLVFDTSESMGKDTTGYDPNHFNPNLVGGCNQNNNCQPLRQAKDAAKSLVNNLFTGYDRVSIVSFNYRANINAGLDSNLGNVNTAIDNVQLHNDLDTVRVRWMNNGISIGSVTSPGGTTGSLGVRTINPIYPEDRDGDGLDADPNKTCVDNFVNNTDHTLGANIPDLWDDDTGDPCDNDTLFDTIDWNDNGLWGAADIAAVSDVSLRDDTIARGMTYTSGGSFEASSVLSTCSGCGIRQAAEVLMGSGRPGAIWVIVFLSDGVANMSDTHLTFDTIPASFRYGFCGPNDSSPTNLALAFWSSYCIDKNTGASAGRFCIDSPSSECPPSTTVTTTSGPYSVEDYAFDMVDRAGLLVSTNTNEPRGEDIIMFSIGLGAASGGENLLRYMANVGDEGSRGNDQCAGIPTKQNCGNYYYAPSASYLAQIFENIAGRIFTKLSR